MSDTIQLVMNCCDAFLDGKRATIAYTYLEPEAGYMGAWQPAAVELDAVVIGAGEYLDSLEADEQKALARRVLEAIEEGWREAEADRQLDEATLDDQYI